MGRAFEAGGSWKSRALRPLATDAAAAKSARTVSLANGALANPQQHPPGVPVRWPRHASDHDDCDMYIMTTTRRV